MDTNERTYTLSNNDLDAAEWASVYAEAEREDAQHDYVTYEDGQHYAVDGYRARWAELTPRRKPDARWISRTLKSAGLTRSSAYSIWGYETPGFIVKTSYTGDVAVLTSLRGQDARDAALTAERVLTDAGYTVEREGRWDHPTQPSHNLRVLA